MLVHSTFPSTKTCWAHQTVGNKNNTRVRCFKANNGTQRAPKSEKQIVFYRTRTVASCRSTCWRRFSERNQRRSSQQKSETVSRTTRSYDRIYSMEQFTWQQVAHIVYESFEVKENVSFFQICKRF